MKLREFIKPNTVKLIITIVLTLLIPFAYHIYPCPELSKNINPYVGISVYEYLDIKCGFSLMDINKFFSISKYSIFYNLIPFFILHVLDVYIISCILFYVYNRIKRVKKLKTKK